MQSVKFRKPPLIEVVFRINIEMREFSLVHFGLYWQHIKERFPAPVETFTGLTLAEDYSYVLNSPNLIYLSSEENKLIQLREDSFSYHCRCIDKTYEHFSVLFKEFLNEWNTFKSWWAEQNKKQIKVEGYSLEYINLLSRNSSDWKSHEDSKKLFNFLSNNINISVGSPISCSCKLNFNLLDNASVLSVSLEPRIIKTSEGKDEKTENILFFLLSVDGFEQESNSIESWFKSSHESIISSFLDLTTKEAKEKWGYENG